MPFDLNLPDGTTLHDVPDGTTKAQIYTKLKGNGYDVSTLGADPTANPDASASKGGVLGGIAMGLRDAVDGGAQLLRRAVPDSVGQAVDNFGNKLADMGLPVARSTGVQGVDQIVHNANDVYDQSRQLAGRSGIDLARIGGNIANPVNTVVPMAGAGGAVSAAGRAALQGAVSGALQPETDTKNFGANKAVAVAGGSVLGGIGGAIAQKIGNAASDLVKKFAPGQTPDVDALVQQAAQSQGIDITKLSPDIINTVKAQVSKNIDPKAALRLAEGEQVLGPQANLTVGQATRDPALYTQEANLGKTGANGGAGAPILQRFADQNDALVGSLNKAGAVNAPGTYQAGQTVADALRNADQQASNKVSGLYDQAKSLNAGDIPMDHRAFADTAMQSLDQSMKSAFLPEQIKGILNDVSSGKTPLTLSVSEQLKSILGNASRSSADGNVKQAIGVVRDALEKTPIQGEVGQAATDAFNQARQAAAQRFAANDANPAMKAALDGSEPDKIFQKFIVNGNANDVQKIIDAAPETGDAIKSQVVDYLKQKATNGANDEVAKFSQSAYNKALAALGDAKLGKIFDADELEQLKRIGRVAANVGSQPAGSAVNNSNTASALINLLSNKMVGSIPGVGQTANILANSAKNMQDKSAVQRALFGQLPSQAVASKPGSISPLVNLPGPLSAYMFSNTNQ